MYNSVMRRRFFSHRDGASAGACVCVPNGLPRRKLGQRAHHEKQGLTVGPLAVVGLFGHASVATAHRRVA